MTVHARLLDGEHQLTGAWDGIEAANAFLAHLATRAFSPATIRAYAFDLVNFARFVIERTLTVDAVTATDVFAWVDWQGVRRDSGWKVVRQPRRLPESLPSGDVEAFSSSLGTHRDRAMALAMLLGGLRSAEVRG